MLVLEVLRYLIRRLDKRPVFLANFVSMGHHHGTRVVEPSVEIIIPTRDNCDLIRDCIDSVRRNTAYSNFEVTVIDNDSKDSETLEYLNQISAQGIRVLRYPHPFNFSKICNFGSQNTLAEFLCFMNNDVVVRNPNWLDLLMDHANTSDVGVVGPLLLYPNNAIQHAGIALGLDGVAGHPFSGKFQEQVDSVELGKDCYQVTAVTFAVALVRKTKFLSSGSLDEGFAVGLNDVAFGIALDNSKSINVLCTKAEITHKESQSRKKMTSLRGAYRASREILRYLANPDLTKNSERFFSRKPPQAI